MRIPAPRALCTALLGTGIVLFSVVISHAGPPAPTPKFLPDDPLMREPDPVDASHVRPFAVHLTWDLVSSLFVKEGEQTPAPAANVNTVDEVPDSSWFTNRAGTRPLSAADVARGPDTTDGPVGRWTVVSGKSEGVRPGFTIRDAAGIVWFLKFDARGYPEQATGAEVVATKLFWALGYNVAETHVATLRRATLDIAPTATVVVHGRKRPLTTDDVDRVLAQADRAADGSYRALASRAIEGTPVGGFLYFGTRPDDANDVVRHEDRRELRAMGVFAAWIDRVDAKAGNTLDTLVASEGHRVVRHHVLDFGSTLGSAGVGPNAPWEGHASLYAGTALLEKLPGAGFPIDSWRRIDYPSLRGVGRFEGIHFAPAQWRPRVPNAAYLRADAADRFWAARKLAALSNDLIAAAVRSGHYSDPRAADYLTGALITRRDAILRAYLPALNPIGSVALDSDGVLTIDNVAARAGAAGAPPVYDTQWFAFDNATRASTSIGHSAGTGTAVQAPAVAPGVSFLRIDISEPSSGHPAWSLPVSAYLRRQGRGWNLVGLERTEPRPTEMVAPATDTLVLRGHAQTLHLYGRRGAPAAIVSSGDGGWIHLGPQVAQTLAAEGFFVVGFDVKAYLASFTSGASTLRPGDEPGDYKVLAEYAARGSEGKPILIGISEGAGLSVLAATDAGTRNAIAGIVGLGLPNVNELGWRWRDSLIYLTHGVPDEPTFTTASLIERASPVPIAAIHATRDEFVPVAEAQRVIAAAREPKRLWIVDASDHRFSDNRAGLRARLLDAIAWVRANETR